MKKEAKAILFLFLMLISLYTHMALAASEDITSDFSLTNTEIFWVTRATDEEGEGDPDTYDGALLDELHIWFGQSNPPRTRIHTYWIEGDGEFYGLVQTYMDFSNFEGNGWTSISFDLDPGEAIFLYNDSNNEAKLDGVLTADENDENWLDDVVLWFKGAGSEDYARDNPEDSNWKYVKDFKYHEIEETIEDDTTVLNWGFSATLVSAKEGNWENYSSIDYELKFHFSAKEGSDGKFKWDLILDNFECKESFYSGYDLDDLYLSALYRILSKSTPDGTLDSLEPAYWEFEGDKTEGTSTYIVEETDVEIDGIKLAELKFGGEYEWNDTEDVDVITSISYLGEDFEVDEENQLLETRLSQNFQIFSGGKIELDPLFTVLFKPGTHDPITTLLYNASFIGIIGLIGFLLNKKYKKEG
mgnify:CR=1 FL=1